MARVAFWSFVVTVGTMAYTFSEGHKSCMCSKYGTVIWYLLKLVLTISFAFFNS